MVLSQFPQSGAEQKQVIDFSAKTAIPKLFNSSIWLNLFLLKILAIKKANQTWFSAFLQNLHSKNLLLKHLISFAFLIIQQRIGAKNSNNKLDNYYFLIASIKSINFFAEFWWANEFLTTNKKANQTWFLAIWQRINFKEQFSKIIDFIRFFS
jgi:hypothetical protein